MNNDADPSIHLRITPLDTTLADIESPIAGKAVVFTGAMTSGSRDDMQTRARELGAETPGSVSKNTNILVCGERVGLAKIEKAQKVGVTVMKESDYLALIA